MRPSSLTIVARSRPACSTAKPGRHQTMPGWVCTPSRLCRWPRPLFGGAVVPIGYRFGSQGRVSTQPGRSQENTLRWTSRRWSCAGAHRNGSSSTASNLTRRSHGTWWSRLTRLALLLASAGERTELGERWSTALEDAAACDVVEMTATGANGYMNVGGGTWTMAATTPVAVLRVQAGGYQGAIDAAITAAAHAARTAEWEPAPAFSAQHAFATDSQPARRNAHHPAKPPGNH